jgi:hypothetical protein
VHAGQEDARQLTQRLLARTLHRASVLLCLFSGVTALGGGVGLIGWHGGAPWLPPLEVLRYTPFDDYLWPGIILFGAVGVPNVLAAIMTLRRCRLKGQAITFAGMLLTGWIVGEMALLRMGHWLQLGYLGVGVLTMVLGAAQLPALGAQVTRDAL